MMNESFLVLFCKKELCLRAAAPPTPRAGLFKKRSKNFLSILCLLLGVALWSGKAAAVTDPSEMLPNPAEEARAEAIGQQLRCLVCQNESIEDSSADLARDIRAVIRQQVVAGRTNRQIVRSMVQRYGTFILLKPPFDLMTAVLWGTPLVALLVGIGIAILGFRQQLPAPAPLSAAECARLKKLLRS